jgi:AraC-like DNA-binding protein
LLILITKKGKTLADFILAAWLFFIGIHTILYVLSLQPASESTIHWIVGVSAPFILVHGPFLYLYTAASTNAFSFKKKTWLFHFWPFVGSILTLMPLYLMSAKEKMDLYNSDGAAYQNFNSGLLIFIYVTGLIYIFLSFHLLRKHKKNIGNQFSYEEKINLNWLRYLIYGLLVIWIIIIVLKKNSLIYGSGVVFVTILGYLGIRQVGIFGMNEAQLINETGQTDLLTDPINTESQPVEAEIPKKKYANSGITIEQANEIHQQLIQLMETEKFYTEPELSLNILAAKLSVHPNYLSQVINEKEGVSFFDYINTLRVNEFKRLIQEKDQSQFTLISIAYDCGFNSKSSFYKNFKKVTGQSPTDYINQLNIN